MDKRAKFLIAGSTITMLSGMAAFLFIGYRRENPSDILNFDIIKACPAMIMDGEDGYWSSGSIMLCKNKKNKPVIIINRNDKSNAILGKKICTWGCRLGNMWIEFLTHTGKKKKIYLCGYDNDNESLKMELINFLISEVE